MRWFLQRFQYLQSLYQRLSLKIDPDRDQKHIQIIMSEGGLLKINESLFPSPSKKQKVDWDQKLVSRKYGKKEELNTQKEERLPSIHRQFNSSSQLGKVKILSSNDVLKNNHRKDVKVHSVGKMESSNLKLPPLKRSESYLKILRHQEGLKQKLSKISPSKGNMSSRFQMLPTEVSEVQSSKSQRLSLDRQASQYLQLLHQIQKSVVYSRMSNGGTSLVLQKRM